MVYSGTLVTHGTGTGVVVATGAETELGEIHRLVGTAASLATPLTRKLGRFSKILTVAILALALVHVRGRSRCGARARPGCSTPRWPSPSGRSRRDCPRR